MGLGELLRSTVIIDYKANIDDAKTKVKELSGEQKKAAQEELKGLEAVGKGYDDKLKLLGKVAIAGGVFMAGLKVGFDGLELAGKRADLQAQIAGLSLDGFRKATRGMVADTELLTMAAAANQGQFKLSQEEMESVTAAAVALGEHGLHSAAEASDAFTQALVTGRTKGLKEFGIQIDDNLSPLQKHNAIIAEAAKLHDELGNAELDASDKMGVAKNSFANSMDEIKISMGRIVEGMIPLVSMVAKLGEKAAGLVGTIVDGWTGLSALARGDRKGFFEAFGRDPDSTTGGAAANDNWSQAGARGQNESDFITGGLYGSRGSNALTGQGSRAVVGDDSLAQMLKARDEAAKKLRELGGTPEKAPSESDIESARKAASDRAAIAILHHVKFEGTGAAGSTSDSLGATAEHLGTYGMPGEDATSSENLQKLLDARNKLSTDSWNERLGKEQASDRSFLEKTFGKPEEFELYKSAFEGLTGAVSTGFDAWLSGSDSAGEAVKKFLATYLKQTATHAAVEGLVEVAHGIGSLASYNYPAAALHFAAAAKWGLVAVAAGAGAVALGSQSGSAAGGAKGSAPKGGGGSSSGGSGSQAIIVYGDSFADDGPRARQVKAKQLVEKALGSTQAGESS